VIYDVARDVTDRKRSEEENRRARDLAEEASRAKGRFLANMSHEIRTPMNGVVSMAGLLAETPLDHRQSGYVKIIQTSARNLLRVINDILDFSKLEQGRLGLESRVFDLRELIGDVAEMFASEAGAKGLRLDWSFAPGMPRQVKADPGRLRQVLVNLVGNAMKFTVEGRVEIRARCLRTGEAGLELRFEVEDTGPGIAPEAGRSLFEPFSQLDLSDTRRHGGTGLGLAISRQLAELMDGEIGFDSVPGRGTCFWFTIRAELPDPGHPGGETAPAEAGQAGPQARGEAAPPLRILVAEDNPINQMVAVCLLERLGHRPEIVANGREALEACKGIEYDVIFMDCQMPELDGYAATARIRRLERKGRRRPYIVAMTADALPGSRERCLQAGMDSHLTKPVLIEDLQAALAQARGAAPALPKAALAGNPEDAIDLRIVERLRDASGEEAEGMFGNLVEGFLAQAREKRAGLEGLAAAGRGDELAKAAHGLKGLSLNFGCRGMARLCEGIQRAAGAGNLREAASLAASLADETARAGDRLRGMIAPAPAGSRAGGEEAHG
jgi:CheY-like chemotaxis protein/HPt (histidine-containing phosphotransfer) domain-containing protein